MIQTYTVQELEPILKRREKTIRNYINNRELKASWIGNGFVVLEEDVRDFLKESYLYDYDNEEEENEEEDEETE